MVSISENTPWSEAKETVRNINHIANRILLFPPACARPFVNNINGKACSYAKNMIRIVKNHIRYKLDVSEVSTDAG